MKKTELLHLHTLLAQFKKYCEENSLDCDFTKYRDLGIFPSHLHRGKEEHKQAIFVLAVELTLMATRTRLKTVKEEA